MISCDPSDLANSARCWSSCIPDQLSVRSYLLCQYANKSTTPPCCAPVGPDNPNSPSQTDTTITVTWTKSASPACPITGFLIKWGPALDNLTTGSDTVGPGTLAYTITGLSASTTVFFEIWSLSGACISEQGTFSSATTSPPPNGLLNSLVHYYQFESFNAANGVDDKVGTFNTGAFNGGADLSINAGGIINNCVACNGAGTFNGLEQISPTVLDIKARFAGDGSLSVSIWGWLDAVQAGGGGTPALINVWGAGAADQFWYCYIDDVTSIPHWDMYTSTGVDITLPWGAAITRNAWHLFVMGYDGTAGKMFFSVDNGALIYSAAMTPKVNQNSGNFVIFNFNTGHVEMTGRADECGIWNPRALTQADIANLWNGGAGLPLSSFTN
jgi:Concanavalin A-like lectin/glucanases superfamily/Fibronectin type III domain